MRKGFKILICISLLVFTSLNVYAEEDTVTTIKKCIDGKEYQISYKNDYVKVGDLTDDNIKAGYVSGHQSDANYKIEVAATETTCDTETNGNYFLSVCPSVGSLNKLKGDYSKTNLMANKKVTITYNLATNKYDIKFAGEVGDSYHIRMVVVNKNETDVKKLPNEQFYSKTFYTSGFLGKSNGTYNASVDPGKNVMFEFYEKSGDCANSFISSQVYQMDSEDNIKIDNPVLKTDTNNYKTRCYNEIINNSDYANDEYSNIIKESIAPFCYNEKLTVNQYSNFNNLVNQAKEKLDEILKNMDPLDEIITQDDGSIVDDPKKKCSNGNGEVKCDGTKESSKTYNLFSNSNFRVQCTDTYKFQGDKPKLTVAGSGFEYGSNIEYSLQRVCSIHFIGTPAVKKPQCVRSCEFISTWNGVQHPGESGGPNEDFDLCINKCDNGQYSQKCINSCYKEVYGEDTKRNNAVDKMSNMLLDISSKGKATNLLYNKNNNYDIKKIVNGVTVPDGYTVVEGDRGTTSYGNPGVNYSVYDPDGNYVGSSMMSDWCSSGHGSTEWTCSVGPSGCSWDPEGEYKTELSSIRVDLGEAKSKMSDALQAGSISMTIVDTHLKNSDGNYYRFKVDDETSNIKILTEVNPDAESSVPVPSGTFTIGASGSSIDGKSPTEPWTGLSKKITVSNIRLDMTSYVGKTYGNVVYNSGNNSFEISKNTSGNYGIRTFSGFKKQDYYNGNIKYTTDGKSFPQYYTSLFTDNMNVKINSDGEVKLNKDCYNIEVRITGFGSTRKKYSFSNSCYYGVYNNYITTDDDIDDDCVGPDCPKPGDIKYIFRPIELTDMFPDREPRWNWTNSATLKLNGKDPYLDYNVNPGKTIEHIEKDIGNTIYADSVNELDYEIIIGGQQIRYIKGYNKDNKSYTDFDMNCRGSSGVKLCESNFLKSATYIKNAGFVRVNATVGTNND